MQINILNALLLKFVILVIFDSLTEVPTLQIGAKKGKKKTYKFNFSPWEEDLGLISNYNYNQLSVSQSHIQNSASLSLKTSKKLCLL